MQDLRVFEVRIDGLDMPNLLIGINKKADANSVGLLSLECKKL